MTDRDVLQEQLQRVALWLNGQQRKEMADAVLSAIGLLELDGIRIAQLEACAQAWIKLEDRLPKEGQVCFVWGPTMTRPAFEAWNPRREIPSVYPIVSHENETEFQKRYDWRWQFAFYENGAITHWMPVKLPEPPEEVKWDA